VVLHPLGFFKMDEFDKRFYFVLIIIIILVAAMMITVYIAIKESEEYDKEICDKLDMEVLQDEGGTLTCWDPSTKEVKKIK